MKVLHLVKTSFGATWALNQMKELVKLGVEVHVAIPLDGYLINEYKSNGITVHELNYNLSGIIYSCRNLRRIVKDIKPDIIHSHFVITTLIMRIALKFNKTPRIFQVPGPLHLESLFFRNLDIGTANNHDFWVGSCKWTNRKYESCGIAKNRLFLSYYGSNVMHKKSSCKNRIRHELRLDDDAILIGMVAYMYAPKRFLFQYRGLKGHEDFIDAISIVAKKYPKVQGVCIGGAWNSAFLYEQAIVSYATSITDHVHFMGTRPDVIDLYPDLFCVVHPSHSENLGGAGESLALGIPTITTNVGGFPDIVINGKTGLLVQPKNPQKLADAIIDLIENKYDIHKMSKNGIELVTKMLDVKNTAYSIYKIYQKILN